MKFDIVVGNPPYGKNANLAVQFLNKSAELSNQIYMVLPRTFRKESTINRVTPHLHLEFDKTVDDQAFPGSIITCYQHWRVLDEPREKRFRFTTHEDFIFTTKENANVCIGRVGAGPCGKVFTENFEHRSPNSHYFLRIKDEVVVEKLKMLTEQFRQQAYQTVGLPSLSKHDLITIYESNK